MRENQKIKFDANLIKIKGKNRKKMFDTLRKLISYKVNIAKKNQSIHELNDCNNQIINLVDKNKINQNECVKLINDVYKYAPSLKPNNGDKLKEFLKKSGYHLALKSLDKNNSKIFNSLGNLIYRSLNAIFR